MDIGLYFVLSKKPELGKNTLGDHCLVWVYTDQQEAINSISNYPKNGSYYVAYGLANIKSLINGYCWSVLGSSSKPDVELTKIVYKQETYK